MSIECNVKVPERVRFWQENVHLSANDSLAFLSRRTLINQSLAEIWLNWLRAVYFNAKIVHVQEF